MDSVAFGAKTMRRKGQNVNKAKCHPFADSDTVHLFVLKRGADCLANTAVHTTALSPSGRAPSGQAFLVHAVEEERGWAPGGGTTGRGLPCRD